MAQSLVAALPVMVFPLQGRRENTLRVNPSFSGVPIRGEEIRIG